MLFGFITLFIIYLLHQYITAWIRYYNKQMKDLETLFGDGHMTIK